VITEGNRLERSRQLWAQVCAARGTLAPDPVQVRAFLSALPADVRLALERTLAACLHGKDQASDMEVLSWAAACTRPSVVAKLDALGLRCSGAALFSAGLSLMATGWALSQRIAHLGEAPADVERLRAVLALQPSHDTPEASEASRPQGVPITPALSRSSIAPMPAALPQHEPTPNAVQSVRQSQAQPDHPALALERPAPSSPLPQSASHLQIKLFGRDAAHTLEVGPHRRSADFLGVHVVTVESARAMQGGGYDWRRKLTIQLTPEEMPAAMAVLMGLSSAVKFAQHGADHDKFVELRRQAGGLLLVTGQQSNFYAVPVKSAQLYYLLDLFCQALGESGRTVTDVLALARASQSG
jgi:hypothetical protein